MKEEIKIQRYPDSILRLNTKDGFFIEYYNNTRKNHTYKKAYELTEQKYLYYFGRKKYSNYESFRQVLNRFLSKKQ